MQNYPAEIRQSMRCGFEPLHPIGRAWQHVGDESDERGDGLGPDICPGYTTDLPEVIETTHARLHWEKGALGLWARGEVTEQQIQAITILEGASNSAQSWEIRNPKKGDA